MHDDMEQIKMKIPKDKKKEQIIIKVGPGDLEALASGMAKTGDTNMSSYIRRLIHENKGGKK